MKNADFKITEDIANYYSYAWIKAINQRLIYGSHEKRSNICTNISHLYYIAVEKIISLNQSDQLVELIDKYRDNMAATNSVDHD